MTGANEPRFLRFGRFEVDLRAGELRKAGVKIKLQQQPFQILVILLQHPNEVVTREELRQQLWPADTFVDFDHSLNAAIKRLRDALGESAENPIFLETLARRGYRFNLPAQAETASTLEPAKPTQLPKGATPRFSYLVLFGALAFVLLLAAVAWFGHAHSNASGTPRISSLAVLPLENLPRDPEQEYFSDGMTNALIADLSKIRPLRVISRTSTVRYKDTKKSLPEIARELNVDAVLEGSVMRSGNRVHINVELIEAKTDKHLWTEDYDRELGDILKLDNEVAQAVASKIQMQLAPEQRAKLGALPTVTREAYEEYLRARFYLTLGPRLHELQLARQSFENSVRLDPSFAPAYAGLADAYLTLGAQRRIPPQEAYRHASEAIHKALELDESLAPAHSSLGYLLWQYDWNWTSAEHELRRALELDPNSMDSRENLVWFLGWSGRKNEALAEIATMRELDPAFPLRCLDRAGLYYQSRDYAQLLQAGQEAVVLNPAEWSGHYFLAVGYFGLGKKSDAMAEFQKAMELSENDSDPAAALAFVYATEGRRSDAQKILSELQQQAKSSYVSPYMLATIELGLGNKDKVFEYLGKSYDEKSTDLAYFMKSDFRLDGVRSDPRLTALAKRMALPN